MNDQTATLNPIVERERAEVERGAQGNAGHEGKAASSGGAAKAPASGVAEKVWAPCELHCVNSIV